MNVVEMGPLERDEVVELYESVGWSAYTSDPDALLAGIQRSTYWVTCRDGAKLVGLARCLSDDFSVMYLQDVLVDPAFQRQGIARSLLDHCLSRFAHVRQRVLFTDDQEHQHRLYRAAGYSDVAMLENAGLHAFVSIAGLELT